MVVPTENRIGRRHLMENGFEEIGTSPRMIVGKELRWNPPLLVNRFMGAMG